MKWLDDAKDKATEAADDAKRRAAEEAGKAAVGAAAEAGKRSVSAAVGAVSNAMEAMADRVLSAAEAELDEQERARGGASVKDAVEAFSEDADTEEVPREDAPAMSEEDAESELARLRARMAAEGGDQEPVMRSERPRIDPFADADAVLRQAAAARGGEPVQSTRRPGADPADPFGAAREAIRASRRARGLPEDDPDEPPAPVRSDDPFSGAQAALERAAAVRATLGKSATDIAREARAKETLAALKGGRGPRDDPGSDGTGDDEPPAQGSRRKRRL